MSSQQVTRRARAHASGATYSNTWQNDKLTWADSIGMLRDRFNRIAPHLRDPRIEAALRAVEHSRPSAQHFIEYMIALDRCGFLGCSIFQDQCAATVKRIAAPRFSPRTLRDAATWAAQNGFIVKGWLPIGDRVETKDGWRTKRIRRYTITARLRLLTSILSLKPALQIVKDDVDHISELPPFPTVAKMATNPSGKQKPGDRPDESPGFMLVSPKRRLEKATGESEESAPSADGSTCPPAKRPASRTTGAHRTPTCRASRGGRHKSAPLLQPPRSLSKTWHTARNRFLSCLFAYLKPGSQSSHPDAGRMYNAASTQTAANYPPNLPAAVDWNDRLMFATDLAWYDLRRLIQREIAPALETFVQDWTPPSLTSSRSSPENDGAFESWEMALIPPAGISVRPANVEAYYGAWPYVRAWITAALHGSSADEIPDYVRAFCALREV